jgi:CHAD domain-containing protein
LIPEHADGGALVDALAESFACARAPETTFSRRVYDSFDWRLFAAGIGLEWCRSELAAADAAPSVAVVGEPGRFAPELVMRDLRKPSAPPARQSSASEPGLLQTLPAGPIRDRIAPVLAMRRLLPLVEVISQRTWLRLLNEDDKTVVRVVIEGNGFRVPDAATEGVLMSRLRLEPVRGYDEAFARAQRVLVERFGLERRDEPLALEALLAAGYRPGSYSSKLDYRLKPGQRADRAAKTIHLGLLDTLEANVDGARRNLDSEFLHELRVATRRTRSALSQIKDVFPESVVVDFKQRFAWLQQATGPMRDLDVYLLDLPALERRLPEGLRTDLQPLQRLLGEQYQAVHAELVRALESERFTSLLRAWRGFLEADAHEPTPADAATSNGSDPLPKRAEQPIKRVADRRIRTMLKRVRDEGRAITDASPPEELHELRKSCKKLRYLMEFFQSLYDKQRIREQIKQTKLLLDNLGRFQDTAVQAEHLRETAEAAGCGEAGLPPATLLAMGVLIGQLLDEQARARAAFSEVFARFDSPDNAARFAALLESGSSDRRRVA